MQRPPRAMRGAAHALFSSGIGHGERRDRHLGSLEGVSSACPAEREARTPWTTVPGTQTLVGAAALTGPTRMEALEEKSQHETETWIRKVERSNGRENRARSCIESCSRQSDGRTVDADINHHSCRAAMGSCGSSVTAASDLVAATREQVEQLPTSAPNELTAEVVKCSCLICVWET